MKPPAKIRIGHAVFDVKTDASAVLDLATVAAAGSSDGNELVLKLRPDLPAQTSAETLLHEVLHMCLFVTGTDMLIEDDVEEKIVRPMAMALFGVLRDNPKFVAYLLNKE